MNAVILANYATLIIPAVIALILLVVVMRVFGMIMKLVILVIIAGLIYIAFTAFGAINGLESATNAALNQSGNGSMTVGQAASTVPGRIIAKAHQFGLDPHYIKVSVKCTDGSPTVHMSYTDPSFLFGLLKSQNLSVPTGKSVHCN